jgi:hypothetical protein
MTVTKLRRWLVVSIPLGLVLMVLAVAPVRYAAAGSLPGDGDRYLIRVTGCDDGGRAYLNGTKIVEVGFGEDSNWLDITPDLVARKNQLTFQVVNKTGAITYRFQVRKNGEMIYDQNCGVAGTIGCEENRAFRVGVARAFVFKIER